MQEVVQKRIETKKEIASKIIENNPTARVITTELPESAALANAIREFEAGGKRVRMVMGTSQLSFEDGQKIIRMMQYAINVAQDATRYLNKMGFGTFQAVKNAKKNDLVAKLEGRKQYAQTAGSEELLKLIEDYEAKLLKVAEEEEKLLEKRMQEAFEHAQFKAEKDALFNEFNEKYKEIDTQIQEQKRKEKEERKKQAAEARKKAKEDSKKAVEKAVEAAEKVETENAEA